MDDSKQTRKLLLMGFGALLLLLALTGLNQLSVLKQIENQNNRIRADYVNRGLILERLRSDIYLSGTYVRDLLIEPDPSLADVHRRELENTRRRVEETEQRYAAILQPEERLPFQKFSVELQNYFASLGPVLQWNADQRRLFGYPFMRDTLLPRRMTIVHLADQISQVNERQLESGNRQVSQLFESSRRSLILLLFLSLLCGLAVACGSILRLLRLEKLSSFRLSEAVQARGALRELSGRLLEVQESERKALSHELHDEVGQALSGLLLGIGNVAAIVSPANREARSQLQNLRRLAERTVAVVRDMSLLLRPSMLDDLGLLPAIQWQAREMSRTKNVAVEVHSELMSEDLPEEHKTCIYRVVQEALRNTARHAKANAVEIRLSERDSRNLHLTIADDGKGFEAAKEKGIGILGMEERVAHLQGSFHIDSKRGGGTVIRVRLPLSAPTVNSSK